MKYVAGKVSTLTVHELEEAIAALERLGKRRGILTSLEVILTLGRAKHRLCQHIVPGSPLAHRYRAVCISLERLAEQLYRQELSSV